MTAALEDPGFACIVYFKGASSLFPMASLEENLRDMPGGFHLEMKGELGGVSLMAAGCKYNSKGTLCFVAPEEAAATLERGGVQDQAAGRVPECTSHSFGRRQIRPLHPIRTKKHIMGNGNQHKKVSWRSGECSSAAG